MKKLIYILSFIFTGLVAQAQVNNCCPEFSLQDASRIRSCPGDSTCMANSVNGGNPVGGGSAGGPSMMACKNSLQTFFVVPNLPGFTFNWTITGGTPNTTSGNPVIIQWGSGNQGFIQVIISDASGQCRDTIRRKVCLLNSPIAGFTAAPGTTVCATQPVTFTNTSSGASTYSWNFGDGTGDNVANPGPHTFPGPGVYTVVLTVSNGPVGGPNAGGADQCGCTDTAMMVINVIAGTGPVITSPNCKKMLCPGDTATYCVSPGCAPYNWTVNGGTIQGSSTGSCIKVLWNSPPSTYPCYVSVTTGCSGSCSNTAILNVPVLYNNITINGPSPVCVGTTSVYTLPVMPGTFYYWTVTGAGGGTIVAADSNTASVTILWNGPPGNAVINCNYTNPYSGCKGSSSLPVKVRRTYKISGPSPACVGTTSTYTAVGGAPSNWTITPGTGYTSTSLSNVPSVSITWTSPGTYVVKGMPFTSANFCNPSDSIIVVVNPKPTLGAITGPSPVCPNGFYNYAVTSNMTGPFTWTVVGGSVITSMGTNKDSVVIQWTGSGTHTINVSQTVNGCVGTATLTVANVTPPPPITITPAGSICSGQTITASVTGPLPPGGYTWSATPGAVLTGGQGTNSATFIINSNATISVSNCAGTTNTNVNITTPAVTVTQVVSGCGATLTATAGGTSYTWFLNGQPAGTGNPFVATQNGNYVVVVTYAGGCTANSSITVTGITPVVASITSVGSLCNGGSVTLVAVLQGNCTGATYTWSNAQTGNTITVNTPGSYSVTVVCNGCTLHSNVINVLPCTSAPGCINDLIIGPPSNCNNPVVLTATPPSGCTPVSTNWNYGDGWSNTTGTHTYNNVGYYTVFAQMSCTNGTNHCDTMIVTIPMVDSFTHVVNCNATGWTINLQDASIYLPAYAGYTYSWSTTCGTLSATNIPNPVLTVPFGCNPIVTLTISKNGCTLSHSVNFNLPTTTFNILGPSTVCKGVTNTYNSSFTTGIISYNWNFGDATTGVTNPIQHTFNGTPVNPTITLSIKDQFGCIFTTTKPVTVIVPPALSIIPSPLVKICPDCAPPDTLTTNPVAGFASYQWYHNGQAISGANSSSYILCTGNASGTYYVQAIHTGTGCPVTSDTVTVVYNPKPVAQITGSPTACLSGGSANIYLANIVNDPTCTYNWTAQGNNTSLSTNFDLNTTVNAIGNYSYVLTVTSADGCVARDTVCVVVGLTPTVTVAPSSTGVLCAGTIHGFTATALPPNPNYIYTWSNGATGTSMSTALAGMYMVTVTDPANGCFAMSFAGVIQPRPSTRLFPIGCDTLCDTDSILPPLALGPGQNYNIYTIQWFLNGNYGTPIYVGPVLNLQATMPPLIYGMNNISIVVTYNGCSDTSNTYNLFIKKCGECDCKESHWGDIILSPGNNVPTGGKMNVIVPGGQQLSCNHNYTLDCNKPYTITAAYHCKDSVSCPPKVTYALQPPSGPVITGNAPFTFTTPNSPGVYTLTLYGWCGGKICDSCVIDLTVKCEPDCDCKGSKWNDITITQPTNNPTEAKAVIGTGGTGVGKLVCGKTYDLKCKTFYSVNAGYTCPQPNCPGHVEYVFSGPTGTTTGTMPLNFSLSMTGTYTLTLYGYCGTKKCDSCVVKFKTDCPVDSSCCKYNISVSNPVTTFTTLSSPPATVVNALFNISGPPGNLFTQIRAEITDYTISSNYNNECLNCKAFPYAWASMYQPGNAGSIQPQITMFGSTVSAFNPSGAGMYQNPREVTWTSASPFALPPSLNLSFLLPSASIIDCCELTAKICVKFTFRDKDCRECVALVCFTVIIKPGGGGHNQACNCSFKPVFSYEGGSKAVACGKSITLFAGNIPVNLNPGFSCKDATGKDCPGSSFTVTVKKPDNTTQVLTGPNYPYTFSLAQTGTFVYTVTGNCGGKNCDCSFNVVIPKN